MKTILGILVLGLLLSNNSWAAMIDESYPDELGWLSIFIFFAFGIYLLLYLIDNSHDTINKITKQDEFSGKLLVYSFINCILKYAVFEGRSSRKEFWSFYVVGILLNIVASFMDYLFYVEGKIKFIVDSGYGPATLVLSLILLCPTLAVGARRLHDVGKSGWWQLISLTGVGVILLIAWWASKPISGSYSKKIKTKKTSSKSKLAEGLRELKELYKDGTLSKEEFTKAKNKLLK